MSASAEKSNVNLFSGSYEFTAPAEVVFGVLTDPDRMSRWLPRGLHTESSASDRVRVRSGSRVYEYDVEVVPDELTVRWRSRDVAGAQASAQVRDAPAGGSVVDAELTVPSADSDGQRVRDLLAETMYHLQRDVSDNFNAG
jgi:uncharacterized protein YndB with AHSA1/START domain